MGCDTSLSAYDTTKLGWTYGTIASWYNQVLTGLYSDVSRSWNLRLPPTITNTDLENRKIDDTSIYGQGNGGHAFTSVLGDPERLAISEDPTTL